MRWEIIDSQPILQHPCITVAMERVRSTDSGEIQDLPKIHTGDHFHVLVLNEADQALILEGYKHGLGRTSWQLVGGHLEEDENPLVAAQRELLRETGYVSTHWRHLGSFVLDADQHVGVSHLFLANNARAATRPHASVHEKSQIRWVNLRELRRALWDGSVAGISYATNIAMGLMALSEFA